MRLIKEKHQLWQRRIAALRQISHQLGQQPQQKGGVDTGVLIERGCIQQADHPPAGKINLHQILDIECRLAKKLLTAGILQHHQFTLNRRDALGGDIAILPAQLFAMLSHPVEHCTQIFHVQQQQSLVISNAECHKQDSRLGLIQLQQIGQQNRPHLRNSGADSVAFFAINIPEQNRTALKRVILDPNIVEALGYFFMRLAWLGKT